MKEHYTVFDMSPLEDPNAHYLQVGLGLKREVNIIEEEHYDAESEDFNPEIAQDDASHVIEYETEEEAEEHPDIYEEDAYHEALEEHEVYDPERPNDDFKTDEDKDYPETVRPPPEEPDTPPESTDPIDESSGGGGAGVVILVIVLILAVLGGVGYYLYKRR